MIRVSSTDFAKNVDRYRDAAQRQAVMVTHEGRETTVMISADEYWRLKRRVCRAGELPDDLFEAIQKAEMDPRHAHLDALIEDWTP